MKPFHPYWTICLGLLPLAATLPGCRSAATPHRPEFRQLQQDLATPADRHVRLAAAVNPVLEEAAPQTLSDLVRLALEQNSEIQEQRLRVESLAYRVPQAASLPDPQLSAMAFPAPVQTAAGEQDFALGLKQGLPWQGKLALQAAMAEEEVQQARAELAATELKVVQQVKQAWYQLQFAHQAIEIVTADQQRLEVIHQLVREMYEVKRDVTQQDVLQVDVARSRLETQRFQYQADVRRAEARLARLLHVSPETRFPAADPQPPQALEADIEALYQLAIQDRPELHAQLAAIERDRKSTSLAQLARYPDLMVGFNWIATSTSGISPVANGDDALQLTLGMNLPVYRGRLDAAVREAETRTLGSARKYDRLKDETMESIADAFARIQALQQTLQLYDTDILPKQDLSLSQSINDYRVNKVDVLQVLENWRQLLQSNINRQRLASELQQALADLARQLGQFDLPTAQPSSEP